MSEITLDKRFQWFITQLTEDVEEFKKKINDLIRDNNFLNKRCEELIKENEEKDKKIDEQKLEIEKLQKIITNMEDGEGVVDFVNDFIKKDEDLIRIQTTLLKDTEETLRKERLASAKNASEYSINVRLLLESEISNVSFTKLEDGYRFTNEIRKESIVNSLNAWRNYYCIIHKTEHIPVADGIYIYKQNDDGTLTRFKRNVKVYWTKEITMEEFNDDPSFYVPIFFDVCSLPPNNLNNYCRITENWSHIMGGSNKVVVQENFQPITQDDEPIHMNLTDVWYVKTRSAHAVITKSFRKSNKFVSLEVINEIPSSSYIWFNVHNIFD